MLWLLLPLLFLSSPVASDCCCGFLAGISRPGSSSDFVAV